MKKGKKQTGLFGNRNCNTMTRNQRNSLVRKKKDEKQTRQFSTESVII